MYETKPNATVGVERTPKRKNHKKLDRLTRDAIAAQEAGMSYGKWKAQHPHTPDEDDEEERDIDPDSVIATCEGCGEQFVKFKWQTAKRFCCSTCQNKYNRQKRDREKKRAKPGKPAVCPICGADFMADYQHRIYCTSECYAESQRRKAKVWNANSREKQTKQAKKTKKVETDLDGVTLTCEQCGVQFVNLKNRKRRFCSTACKNVSYNNERAAKRRQEAAGRTATCAVCGKTFTPDNGNCIYCSPGCHAVGKNRNNREWYARNKEKKEAAENGSN